MTSLAYAEPSPFPPSFDGSPFAYGFGLFGDVVGAALSLAMLLGYLFEARRNREVSRRVGNWLGAPPAVPVWSPLYIYRLGKISIFLCLTMRTLPDCIWMLSWGEVSDRAIRVMLAIDLWLDGLSIFPLLVSILCWAWGRQVIPQKLSTGPEASVRGRLPWDLIARNLKIVVVVFVIAIGVTIGKASG